MLNLIKKIKPNEIYEYNGRNGSTRLLWKKEVPDYNSEDFITRQIFYPSKDGTLIPMYVSHQKDLKINQNTPLLLYGYGGFDISILPSFRERYLAWMKMGGILAVPNLRGGGEYGEKWHRQGMLDNKQNVPSSDWQGCTMTKFNILKAQLGEMYGDVSAFLFMLKTTIGQEQKICNENTAYITKTSYKIISI